MGDKNFADRLLEDEGNDCLTKSKTDIQFSWQNPTSRGLDGVQKKTLGQIKKNIRNRCCLFGFGNS